MQTVRHPIVSTLTRISATCGILLLAAGCAATGSIRPAPGAPDYLLAESATRDVIQVQYLGTGGYLFRRGDNAFLTAPLYSNPGLLRVAFGRIAPRTARIDQLHPHANGADVQAILVGHAHYDHLLDVPYIAARFHPQATIYGSASVGRIVVAADPSLAGRMRVLGPGLARDGQPGEWIYLGDGTIRFMAIESDHGPHSWGLHLMQGEVRGGLKHAPRRSWGWREGQTLAYLIDFLAADGHVDFRVHYQDATSHFPLGGPPEFVSTDSHRVDLAIVAVGAWFQVPDYPGALLQSMRPRHVILGHWENFFRSALKPPRPIVLTTRLRAFVDYIDGQLPEDSRWLVPLPMATYLFPVTAAVAPATSSPVEEEGSDAATP